jgi:hypothetical protein
MMPMAMRRKTRDVEKVENLCRTATAWKILPARRNKPDQACAIRCAPKRWRAPSSVAAAGTLISTGRKPRAQSVAREEGDGEREHDQIVVERVGLREQDSADRERDQAVGAGAGVSHRPDRRPCRK